MKKSHRVAHENQRRGGFCYYHYTTFIAAVKIPFSLSFRRIILIRQICCVYYPQLSKNAQNIRNPVPF